jgi:lipopolysaccharide export system permease protein
MPNLIDRYVARCFLKSFTWSLLLFTAVTILVQISADLDMLIDNEASFSIAAAHYIYRAPAFLVQVIPISALMGAFFTMGMMSRSGELTALKASGMSVYRASAVLIVFGFILSILVLIANEFIIPVSNKEAERIKKEEILKFPNVEGVGGRLSASSGNGFSIHAGFVDATRGLMRDFILDKIDEGMRIRTRITGKEAIWKGGDMWILKESVRRDFDRNENIIFERSLPSPCEMRIAIAPEDLLKEYKPPSQMSISELRKRISRRKMAHLDSKVEEVELYHKLFFPSSCLILVLLGIPSALGMARGSVPIVGVGISFLVSFLYYGLLAVSHALGKNGLIPPPLAGAMANLFFLALSSILLMRSRT